MNDTYREGNLKFLEMMISQINDFIENTRRRNYENGKENINEV